MDNSDLYTTFEPLLTPEDYGASRDPRTFGTAGFSLPVETKGFLTPISYLPKERRGVYSCIGHHDPWVKQALKAFDSHIYGQAKLKTRRPGGLEGMYHNLMGYDTPNLRLEELTPRQQIAMRCALTKARTAFTLPVKIKRMPLSETINWLESSTSAGYTFRGFKKGDVKEEIIQAARKLSHTIKIQMKEDEPFNPTRVRFPYCLAAQRGGLSNISDDPSERKTRLVWIYPAEVLALEAVYAVPLYEAIAKWKDSPMLYGNDADRTVTSFFTNCNVSDEEAGDFIGTDIKGFDQHIPRFLIKEAFDIAFDNFDDAQYVAEKERHRTTRRGMDPVEYERRHREIHKQALEWYFTNTPILMPDGRAWRKHQGVPSGTAFTQLVDSIVNYIFITYVSLLQNAPIRGLKVLGDDSGFWSERFDLARAEADLLTIGAILSGSKTERTQHPSDFKLLGFKYDGTFRRRPDQDWFEMSLCPESWIPDLSASFGRLYGMYLAGGKQSPLFCRFMNFYQAGFPIPDRLEVPKDTRRWLTRVLGITVPSTWSMAQRARMDLH